MIILKLDNQASMISYQININTAVPVSKLICLRLLRFGTHRESIHMTERIAKEVYGNTQIIRTLLYYIVLLHQMCQKLSMKPLKLLKPKRKLYSFIWKTGGQQIVCIGMVLRPAISTQFFLVLLCILATSENSSHIPSCHACL